MQHLLLAQHAPGGNNASGMSADHGYYGSAAYKTRQYNKPLATYKTCKNHNTVW